MSAMKLFGLTGGVGMGKSVAAGFFQRHGVKIVDTDELARELVQPGQPALAEIRRHFGPDVFSASGELNRAGLARLVFASASAREKLETILHPRIRAAWQAQVETWRIAGCPLAAATEMGVSPVTARALTCAPRARKAFTSSSLPPITA